MESLSAEHPEMVQRLMGLVQGLEDPELSCELPQDNGWQLEEEAGACLPSFEAAASSSIAAGKRQRLLSARERERARAPVLAQPRLDNPVRCPEGSWALVPPASPSFG